MICQLPNAFLRLALLLAALLLPHDGLSESNHGAFLTGKWRVTGVRLDETLSRTPGYNIDDPELMGGIIRISQAEIRTDMPEGTHCRQPAIDPEKTSIEELVDRTMGKGMYSEDSHNKFELPVDTSKEVEVFWVRCKEGHFGPDYPFGPKGQNWIAKLSPNKLAMRWYDNTILLLNRVQILPEPRKKRAKIKSQSCRIAASHWLPPSSWKKSRVGRGGFSSFQLNPI